MSDWDVMYDGDMISPCACGKGHVRMHVVETCDDWGRWDTSASEPVLECSLCAQKYHVEMRPSYTQPTEPGGAGWIKKHYLVPNGFSFKPEERMKYHEVPLGVQIYRDYYEKYDSKYRKLLFRIIDDFERAGAVNRLLLPESQEIVRLFRKHLNTQSCKKILTYLKDVGEHPETYSEQVHLFYDGINQEKMMLEKVRQYNASIAEQSYELCFQRCAY